MLIGRNFLGFFSFLAAISFSQNANASGFNWMSQLAKATGFTEKEEYIFTYSVVIVLLAIAAFIYKIKVSQKKNPLIPDDSLSLGNMWEFYGKFIRSQCHAVIGAKNGDRYFSYVATVFLVILVSNLTGLIPGFLPPTAQTNTTFALGMMTFLYYNYQGIKTVGLVSYLKHFCGPLWYMAILIFPIEILSNAIRPFSLALRLRSNMDGDHIVLGTFSALAPLGVPVIFLILGILVSLIQAYVFTVLSMVYISLAVENHDHDSHGHEKAHH